MTILTISPSLNVSSERVIGDSPRSLLGRDILWREPLLKPWDLLAIFFLAVIKVKIEDVQNLYLAW